MGARVAPVVWCSSSGAWFAFPGPLARSVAISVLDPFRSLTSLPALCTALLSPCPLSPSCTALAMAFMLGYSQDVVLPLAAGPPGAPEVLVGFRRGEAIGWFLVRPGARVLDIWRRVILRLEPAGGVTPYLWGVNVAWGTPLAELSQELGMSVEGGGAGIPGCW